MTYSLDKVIKIILFMLTIKIIIRIKKIVKNPQNINLTKFIKNKTGI